MAGRPVHIFEVLRSEQLTPHIVRVVLGGSGFNTFTPNDFRRWDSALIHLSSPQR